MTRRPYVRQMSRTRWFLRQPRYLRYIARECTCLAIGAYAWLLIVGIARLSEGRKAYDAFLAALTGSAGVLLHLVVLAFALYHTFSWFNVTPKAMPVRIGERFAPPALIIGAHYAVWAVLTGVVLFLAGAL